MRASWESSFVDDEDESAELLSAAGSDVSFFESGKTAPLTHDDSNTAANCHNIQENSIFMPQTNAKSKRW